MTWKAYVGATLNSAYHSLLSQRWFPLMRAVPYGRSWLYDVQRFSRTKNLDVVFDVGANIGQTANGILHYFPGVSLYCFEPVSSTYSSLVANYGNIPNVHCVDKALGSTSGTAVIQLHDNSELNTLVPNQPRKDDLTGGSEVVSIDTVDTFCESNGIHYIDILKMDVQGWEMEVLRGASRMIENGNVRYVFAEVGFRSEDSDMQDFAELNRFMEETAFGFCGLYDCYRRGPNKEFVYFANALYFNPEFRSRR